MNDEQDLLENLLAQVVSGELELELTEENAVEAYVESPEQAERMRKLFATKSCKSNLRVFIKYYSRIAAVLFLAVLIGGAALLASPSLREDTADFLTGRSAGQDVSSNVVDVSSLAPSEIPEDYVLISCSVSENWTTYLYQNEQNQVLEVELFSPQRPVDSSTAFGEGIMISQVFEVGNGSDAAECGRIQVQMDGYTVVVTGLMSEEELQAICNSISEK